MENESYPRHVEAFEVVLLRDGVNQMAAKWEDFKRLPVEAENTLQAQMLDAVRAEKGWSPIFATKPGLLTEPEVLARRREMDQAQCSICLPAPCTCKAK